MQKRNATALSEILYTDINAVGDYVEDAQKLLYQKVLGLTSGVIYGLTTVSLGASGVTVATGAIVDNTYAYALLENPSGLYCASLPTSGTRIDTVAARYLEVSDSPGASYVLIDVSSRVQTTTNVYRRRFGSVQITIEQNTASGALTGNKMPIASLTVTSGGIQSIADVRSIVSVSNLNAGNIANAAVGGDLTGTVSNSTVVKLKNIPISGTPVAGQTIVYNGTTYIFAASGASGAPAASGSSVLDWTNSGSTIASSGTLVYTIPAPASGSLTIIPGNGQLFFKKGTYTINGGRTTLTFNTTNDVPLVGTSIEYFYSA